MTTSEQEAKQWWYWYVTATPASSDEEHIFHARAPHRVAAKLDVKSRVESAGDEIEAWGRTYIPRPHFDCPECHGHESTQKLPNLMHDWDWECMRLGCGAKFWGHPQDPEKVVA